VATSGGDWVSISPILHHLLSGYDAVAMDANPRVVEQAGQRFPRGTSKNWRWLTRSKSSELLPDSRQFAILLATSAFLRTYVVDAVQPHVYVEGANDAAVSRYL
jgi:hypothetical protein